MIGFQYDVTNTFWSRLVQDADEDYMKRVTNGKYINSFDPKNFIARKEILQKIMFDSNQVYMEDADFYIRSKDLTRIRFALEIKVGHHNKSSLYKVIKVNFSRGYWLFKLYTKNKDKNKLKDMPLFTGTNRTKIMMSPILAIALFFKNPPKLAIYKIIAGTSWMAGEAYYYFKNGNKA